MRTSLVSVLVAGGITAVLATSPASAITFTTSSVSVTDSINQPNIGYSSTGLNANLAIGTPVTIDDFIQAGVNGNSFQSPQTETISVTLNFSTPPGASGNIDSGTIGASVVQSQNHITIAWNDPITILFANGTHLRVDLANIDFNCGSSCNQDSFNIAGTFTALNGPTNGEAAVAATPIPAALPMFASGGALLGYFGWRRKKKQPQ